MTSHRICPDLVNIAGQLITKPAVRLTLFGILVINYRLPYEAREPKCTDKPGKIHVGHPVDHLAPKDGGQTLAGFGTVSRHWTAALTTNTNYNC